MKSSWGFLFVIQIKGLKGKLEHIDCGLVETDQMSG
jgi:hypothetical protein